MSRADKSEMTRQRLFNAAAKVVGELGYAEASISKITQKANIAQGTFYNYFQTRQELFDALLPALGDNMLAHIRDRVEPALGAVQREEYGLRAFFSYLATNPEFYRILNEAEIFAPLAYKQHMQNIIAGYLRSLKRSRSDEDLAPFSDADLEVLAYLLTGARNYLAMRYGRDTGQVPEYVVSAFMAAVSGIFSPAASTENLNRNKFRQTIDPYEVLIEQYQVLEKSKNKLRVGLCFNPALFEHNDDIPVKLVTILQDKIKQTHFAGLHLSLSQQVINVYSPLPKAATMLTGNYEFTADKLLIMHMDFRSQANENQLFATMHGTYKVFDKQYGV